MNRAALLDSEPKVPVLTPQAWWVAGKSMNIGEAHFPRGAIVPDELVAAFQPQRLAVMVRNSFLVHRIDAPDAMAAMPEARPIVREDPAAEARRQREAMERAGYQPWEIDHRVKAPSGAYASQHPSKAVVPHEPVLGPGLNPTR